MTTDRDPTIMAAGDAARVAGHHLNDNPHPLASAEWRAWRAGYYISHVDAGKPLVTAQQFGRQAKTLGTLITANPYSPDSNLGKQWSAGWNGTKK